MHRNQKAVPVGGSVLFFLLLLNVVVMERGFVSHPAWYKAALVTLALLLIAVIVYRRKCS